MSSCSVLLYLLPPTNYPATHSHTAVNWLGAPRCLRQMKRCSEQEETTSIAKRSTVLGCSVSFVSAFGENSFITYLVLSPKGKPFWAPLQGDYVSDRKGRWFESNRGSHLRSLEPQRVQGFSLF